MYYQAENDLSNIQVDLPLSTMKNGNEIFENNRRNFNNFTGMKSEHYLSFCKIHVSVY